MRKCHDCKQYFSREELGKNIRCQKCREARRVKTCKTCSSTFKDESLKNTRKFCDQCTSQREAKSRHSPRMSRRRSSRVAKGSGGRLDQFDTLKPYTNTWWGRVGELLFLYLYPSANDAVAQFGNKSSFDMYNRELGLVDVKTAKAKKSSQGLWKWSFQIDGVRGICDHAFLIGFDSTKTRVENAWLIPAKSLPSKAKNLSPSSNEYADAEFELSSSEVVLLNRKLNALLSSVVSHEPQKKKPKKPDHYKLILGKLGESIYKHWNPSSEHVAATNPVATYDFKDADGVCVNVKTRRAIQRGSTCRWTFFQNKGCTAQDYFCIGLNAQATHVEKVWRIPKSEMPSKGFSVSLSTNSKYERFALKHLYPCRVSGLISTSDLDSAHINVMGLNAQSLKHLSEGEREALLHQAFAYYRIVGFPYPAMPSDALILQHIKRLRLYQADGQDFPVDQSGLHVCSAYMPHRFDSKNSDADFSALGAFENDARLMKALRFCLQGKDVGLRPRNVRSALTALNRTPVNFRPAVAKALVEQYCPQSGRVLDPCAGWGGRLFGALVAGCSYTGVDLNKPTADALYALGFRLTQALGVDRDCVEIIHGAVQDQKPQPSSFDFALTSPPFWVKEQYGSEDLSSFEDWSTNMLLPLFNYVFSSLKPNTVFALHITDVVIRGRKIPLEKTAIDMALRVGFLLEASLRMHKSVFAKQAQNSDPIFIFRKPNEKSR